MEADKGQPLETANSLKTSSQRWWLMLLLVSGMIICYAQRGAIGIATPYMTDLKLSPAAKGILLSAFFWLYSFMQMPAGWVVDRLGVRRAYMVGFLVWSVASAATGLAGGLASLIVLQMILGVGQAVAFPASARAVANWFQNKERGTVTASYLTGVRLGQALIGALGSYFLLRYSWELFLLVISVIPLLWLIPWNSFLKKREAIDQALPETKSASGNQTSFLGALTLLRNRTVFGIFLGFFAFDYVWFIYTRWLGEYLDMAHKLTPAEKVFWMSVPFIAMSVFILLSGALSDLLIRRGYSEIRVRKSFIVAGLLVAALIVPAGIVSNSTTALWLLTISLCGLGVCSPNTWTLTQAVCSRTLVGTVSGIQNFGGNLGGILAPTLTGFIVHTTHTFTLAFSLSGGILIVGIFAYIFLIGPELEVEKPVTEPVLA